MLLLLLACTPSTVTLEDDGIQLDRDRDSDADADSDTDSDTDADTDTDTDSDTDADTDTDADSDSDTDTGTPDRPCAFIDNWIADMQLPTMTLYRYEMTGCGVVQGCTCDDPDIANAGVESAAFLDGSQGPVVLVVNAWIAGATACTCTVLDYDYYGEFSSSYTVTLESTE